MRTALLLMMAALPVMAADKDESIYELRIYWAAEGKMDALHARFKDHTMKLFEKHGMTNIAYWTPLDESDKRLIYVVKHKDKAAQGASWKAFIADPDWKSAHAASEKDGKLVKQIFSINLAKTDFSPAKPQIADGGRVFEMRTYVTTPNNRDALLSRFRDHTCKLFEKHGMTNIAYTIPVADDAQTNAKLLPAVTAVGDDKAEVDLKAASRDTTFLYFLAHKDKDAAKKSFDNFRADPVWVAAKADSEKKAGGSLTVKDGVKSLFLKPTEYSPLK